MSHFVLQRGSRGKGLPPFPCAPNPAEPPPLRFGQSRLTIPNTCSTITVSASLRSDCCSPSLRNAVRLPPESMFTSPEYQFLRILLDGLVFVALNTECGGFQMLSTCAADGYGFAATSTTYLSSTARRPTLRVPRRALGSIRAGIPAWHQQCCALLVFLRILSGQRPVARFTY